MTAKIYIPAQKDALQEAFFARHAADVARDLLGRTLVRERPQAATLYARIQEIAAWEGRHEDSMTDGALYAPGTLAVSTKYGKNMLDIATYKICEPSCITLIGAVVSDKQGRQATIHGAGNLAKLLEIDKELFHGLPLRLSPLWIGGEPVEPTKILKRKSSNTPRNCQGYFYFR